MTDDLLQRLTRLEERQALIELKHNYCDYCDDNYNPDKLATLFTEDAIWNGGILGKANTRDGIKRYFANSSKAVRFAIHHVTNPLIKINANQAVCRWYLWQPMVFKSNNQAYWYAAKYDDVCVKQNGHWLFKSVNISTRLLSPYEQGFAQTPIANI